MTCNTFYVILSIPTGKFILFLPAILLLLLAILSFHTCYFIVPSGVSRFLLNTRAPG